MALPEPFEHWAIVEVSRGETFAGFVTECVVGGATFIRVDVPATKRSAEVTKLFGWGAVYCITPVDEKAARSENELLNGGGDDDGTYFARSTTY